MNRHNQLVNERYEALMFAKTPQAAQKAARELVRIVLGEEAVEQPLEQALRDICRVLRPSQDPREQARFEAEFLELAFWPNGSQSQTIAA
jgi:HEPN domain-containing protein